MAYYLGRDVVVALTTEIAGQGVDVEPDGTVDTFAAADGTGNSGADTLFAGPRARRNAANSPNTNFSGANVTIFGTQVSSVIPSALTVTECDCKQQFVIVNTCPSVFNFKKTLYP